jgi:hypothetical protein
VRTKDHLGAYVLDGTCRTVGWTRKAAQLLRRVRLGPKLKVCEGNADSGDASAKTEEAMFADIAAQRNEANASKNKVEKFAVGPSNISFVALWTCNGHGP